MPVFRKKAETFSTDVIRTLLRVTLQVMPFLTSKLLFFF